MKSIMISEKIEQPIVTTSNMLVGVSKSAKHEDFKIKLAEWNSNGNIVNAIVKFCNSPEVSIWNYVQVANVIGTSAKENETCPLNWATI